VRQEHAAQERRPGASVRWHCESTGRVRGIGPSTHRSVAPIRSQRLARTARCRSGRRSASRGSSGPRARKCRAGAAQSDAPDGSGYFTKPTTTELSTPPDRSRTCSLVIETDARSRAALESRCSTCNRYAGCLLTSSPPPIVIPPPAVTACRCYRSPVTRRSRRKPSYGFSPRWVASFPCRIMCSR
jgi:hypothetical protein